MSEPSIIKMETDINGKAATPEFPPNPDEFTKSRAGEIRYDLPGCLSKEQLDQFYQEVVYYVFVSILCMQVFFVMKW